MQTEEQEDWIVRKGELHGFTLPQGVVFDFSESASGRIDVRITHEQMIRGKQHSGNPIRIYSVLYEGILIVREPEKIKDALRKGIGHGKAMGLGLLSVIPVF